MLYGGVTKFTTLPPTIQNRKISVSTAFDEKSPKKLWSTNNKVGDVSSNPPKLTSDFDCEYIRNG